MATSLDLNSQQAVDDDLSRIFEVITEKLESGGLNRSVQFLETIEAYTCDSTNILNLCEYDRVSLIQAYSPDKEMSLNPTDLRCFIEQTASQIVLSLAKTQATATVLVLLDFLKEQGLTLANLASENGNHYGWAKHDAEYQAGDHCHVLVYRNLDGERNQVNVYQWDLAGLQVVFERQISPSDTTQEGNTFQTT